jgi:hypothetical protein
MSKRQEGEQKCWSPFWLITATTTPTTEPLRKPYLHDQTVQISSVVIIKLTSL